MTYTPKDWRDFPDTGTPVTAAALEDLETRLASYSETYSEAQGPYINVVTEYGADPSGTADCATAINNAITAANTAGGGTIWFPKGMFRYGTALILKSNVNLRGSGHYTTTLKPFDNTPAGTHLAIKNDQFGTAVINNVIIRDICFDMNRAGRDTLNGTGGNFEFRGVNTLLLSSNIHVADCRIINVKGMGLSFQKCIDCSVRNCIFDNVYRDGIHLNNNCHRFFIANNTLTTVGDDFIVVHSGITSGDTSDEIVIAGNILRSHDTTASNFGGGIAINGANRVTITGNLVYDTYAASLVISNEQAAPCRRITVVGNVFQDAGLNNSGQGDAINIFNRFATGSYYTDPAQASVEDITIANNVIANPKRYGIWSAGQSTALPIQWLRIQGNVFSTIGSQAMRFEDFHRGIGIAGNVFREVNGRAMELLNTGHVNFEVTGNRFNNTNKTAAGAALNLSALAGGLIANNRFDDTQGTKTMTSCIGWGTAANVLATGNNMQNAGGSFSGTQAATSKKHANMLSTGAFEHGDTA